MTQPGKIRVLIVDDHPLLRDGIAYALRSQTDMELAGEASSGEEAISAFRRCHPDITLMDIRMPGLNGIEAIEMIRAECPRARIIALTTYSGDVQAIQALKAGASGYLLKSTLRTELTNSIREVHDGRKRIPSEIALRMAEHLNFESLSAREVEVLRSVARGHANKMIASDLSIAEDTVKGHMRSIMAKLGANDRTHAVLIALERGYLRSDALV